MPNVIATRRGEEFADKDGVPNHRSMVWIEEVTRRVNDANDDVGSTEDRLDELEPNYIVIDATDSPYAAANNDYLLADMSVGNVDVTLPALGRLSISRDGASNTLTLVGTVNGVTDPTIVADGDAPALAFIGTEFRYV